MVYQHQALKYSLSDNGSNFSSKLVTDVCKDLNVNKVFMTPYNTKGDGLCECTNRSLQAVLSTFVNAELFSWWKSTYCLLHNKLVDSSFDWFFAIFSELLLRIEYSDLMDTVFATKFKTIADMNEYAKHLAEDREKIRNQGLESICSSQEHQKQQYGKTATEVSCKKWDLVYLKKKLQ